MSEQNRSTLIRWFEEIWNRERPEVVDELMDADCVLHDGSMDIRGPAEFHRFRAGLHEQFTHIRVQIHEATAEGDLAWARWSSTMRHKATGQALTTTGMSMVRFKDGRVAEAWQNWDRFGLMQQIGRPGSAAASASL